MSSGGERVGISSASHSPEPPPKKHSKQHHHPSLFHEKILAMLFEFIENKPLLQALLITSMTLFLLLKFPFYGFFIPLILVIVAAVAYYTPPFGTIIGLACAVPAIAHQSPALAWLFGFPLALSMFLAFRFWKIIAMAIIIILAPFSPFGFVIIPLMTLAALRFGSKGSLQLSIPSLYLMLLLSMLWGIQNTAFLPVGTYPPTEFLSISSETPSLSDMPSAIADAFSNLFAFEHIANFSTSLDIILLRTFQLFFEDSGLISLGVWSFVLFMIGFLPGEIRFRYKNTVASAALLLLVPTYFLTSAISYGDRIDPLLHMANVTLLTMSVVGTILFVFLLEWRGIDVSRERQIRRLERQEKFGTLHVQDLGVDEPTTLEDVGGYEDILKELKETILWPLQKKELSIAYGIKPPRGILLFGPPGCGKTMIMRALAKELDAGFYYVKSSDLLSQWYGESEHNISKLFDIAKKNAPCILFFDEIDIIGKRRDLFKSEDVGPRLLSTLLIELDGCAPESKVVVIGATNLPHQLDRALLRPGRFDKIFYLPLPNRKARVEILKKYTKNLPLEDDIDLEKIADMTERFSGADLKNLVSEAKRLAAERAVQKGKVVPLTTEDFVRCAKSLKPSVPLELLEEYEKFKMDFERHVSDERPPQPKEVSWDDVADLEDVKKAFEEAVELPLKHPELIEKYNITPPKGILLFGPPGCGKTLVVKAAAHEIHATFIVVSGADLLKEGYGSAVELLKQTFNRAKEQAPSLIFIDEIETLAPIRGRGGPIAEQIVAELLVELDGIKTLKNVVLVGATNRPDMLDPALLRPGRFDKIIFISPPDKQARREIFALNLQNIPLRDISLDVLAEKTVGFSGADIASICQEAKMEVVRRKLRGEDETLTAADFERILKTRKPSVTKAVLESYLRFLHEYGERR